MNMLKEFHTSVKLVLQQSKVHMEDVDAAGGISAILHELSKKDECAGSFASNRNRKNYW